MLCNAVLKQKIHFISGTFLKYKVFISLPTTRMTGVLVTYLFTPRYDAFSLQGENPYLVLEHDCLRPHREELSLLSAVHDMPVMSYTMVQAEGPLESDYDHEDTAGYRGQ